MAGDEDRMIETTDGPVRLIDVARAAEVSPATASRVLNGHPVDAELTARVIAVADRLDYRPNAVARNLRRQDTQVWAVVVTDITNAFYTSMVRGIEDVAQRSGYSVLLGNSDEEPGKEERYLRVAEAERVAGVVLTPSAGGGPARRLARAGIPVVCVDRPLTGPDAPAADCVMTDSGRGAEEATEHLLAQGWRRPACLPGPKDTHTARERAAGYRRAVRRAGVGSVCRPGPFTVEGGREGVRRLLAADEPPDALLLGNATLALGALEALAEAGLRIGHDLGVVTFDDPPWAALLDPPLTVVSQPAYAIGTDAAELLLQRMAERNGSQPVTRLLPTTLITRASSLRR